MTKRSIIYTALCLSVLLGCGGTDDPSSISVNTVQSAVHLRSIAPGVSEGVYADQQVLYVDSQGGADWLLDNALQEYNTLFDQYVQTYNASLLPRLNCLQSTLQVTSERFAGPFLITSISELGSYDAARAVAGPSCSGGGSECKCADGCSCISDDNGCSCFCD